MAMVSAFMGDVDKVKAEVKEVSNTHYHYNLSLQGGFDIRMFDFFVNGAEDLLPIAEAIAEACHMHMVSNEAVEAVEAEFRDKALGGA